MDRYSSQIQELYVGVRIELSVIKNDHLRISSIAEPEPLMRHNSIANRLWLIF